MSLRGFGRSVTPTERRRTDRRTGDGREDWRRTGGLETDGLSGPPESGRSACLPGSGTARPHRGTGPRGRVGLQEGVASLREGSVRRANATQTPKRHPLKRVPCPTSWVRENPGCCKPPTLPARPGHAGRLRRATTGEPAPEEPSAPQNPPPPPAGPGSRKPRRTLRPERLHRRPRKNASKEQFKQGRNEQKQGSDEMRIACA